MPETTPQLTESDVEAIAARLDRFLSSLVFGEPERGNRYVESVDGNYYFEENADNEYDAFDLLQRFPALIRDWRALRRWKAEALPLLTRYDNLAETFGGRLGSSKVTNLEQGVAALREQLAEAIRERDGARNQRRDLSGGMLGGL